MERLTLEEEITHIKILRILKRTGLACEIAVSYRNNLDTSVLFDCVK